MPDIVNNYTNEQLASAAYRNTGVDPDQVPLNSDLGTASTADVQTSPTDATAGAVLNNETTSIGGFVNFTEANYQPETFNGLGVVKKLKNNSGGSIANGATVSGSLLAHYFVDATGTLIEAGATGGSGTTWMNVSGSNVGNGNGVEFVRVS